MAVHIRLQRRGTRNRSFFHLVVSDHKSARDGQFIEKLGYYDPNIEPSAIQIDEERTKYWFSKGAQLSQTAKKLVKIKGLTLTREQTTKPSEKKK
ncbi:MAG: 30S ribosomal protein S16 [Deltaproteobacteria bacterium]|nr:30S ribosomal protein S16 [Deltaproteobacteria bacterium]